MRRFSLLVLALSVSAFGAAAAGSYDDGLRALERKDYAAARTLLRDAAEHGDGAAQYNLGLLLSRGQGAPPDVPAALAWFREAAAQGHPGAEYNLALLYQTGIGAKRDPAAATDWYMKAANQGHTGAQARLAGMLANGEGRPRDDARAAKWFREAARQGDPDAAFNLGLIYAAAARGQRQTLPRLDLQGTMDAVFGKGAWRETSGYRTVAQEDALRAAGAGTVPAGVLSRHSVGTPDRPGAYDVVVTGLAPEQAASKFRRSGLPFLRMLAEDDQGGQGAHLHLELYPADPRSSLWRPTAAAFGPGLDVAVTPKSPGVGSAASAALSARYVDEARMWFRRAATQGQACAKLALQGAAAHGPPGPTKECAAILASETTKTR